MRPFSFNSRKEISWRHHTPPNTAYVLIMRVLDKKGACTRGSVQVFGKTHFSLFQLPLWAKDGMGWEWEWGGWTDIQAYLLCSHYLVSLVLAWVKKGQTPCISVYLVYRVLCYLVQCAVFIEFNTLVNKIFFLLFASIMFKFKSFITFFLPTADHY